MFICRCVGQGVFRGTGKQTYGAAIALVGYYAVAIPVAFTLANKAKLGLKGMCKFIRVYGYVFRGMILCYDREYAGNSVLDDLDLVFAQYCSPHQDFVSENARSALYRSSCQLAVFVLF